MDYRNATSELIKPPRVSFVQLTIETLVVVGATFILFAMSL